MRKWTCKSLRRSWRRPLRGCVSCGRSGRCTSDTRRRPRSQTSSCDESRLLSEWPDAELKSSPNFSKSCPKSNHSSLTWQVSLFTLTENWASFDWNHFIKNFQKSPNLVPLPIVNLFYEIHIIPTLLSRKRLCLYRNIPNWKEMNVST